MNFFVSVSSVAAARFSNITKSPNVRHFSEANFHKGVIIPKDLINHFNAADVIVINGTWGNSLRKELYLDKDDDGNYVLNSPSYRNDDGSISYKIRSAILDEINTQIIDMANRQEKPVVVFESSTISRAEKNYNDHHSIKSKFRMGLRGWIYKEAKWLEPSDFQEVPKINAKRLYDHSWRMSEDGAIYILTGLETDPTSTLLIYDFIHNSICTARKHTDRRIVVKIHPGSPFLEEYLEFEDIFSNVSVMRNVIPIKELYDDMYCAVIDNSTSIFELIDAGIPTYCSDVNFGAGLKNTDLNTINNIHLASKDEIRNWTNHMCCTELSVDLLDQGDYMKKLIRTLIERKS
jgi:hypothetical protein